MFVKNSFYCCFVFIQMIDFLYFTPHILRVVEDIHHIFPQFLHATDDFRTAAGMTQTLNIEVDDKTMQTRFLIFLIINT